MKRQAKIHIETNTEVKMLDENHIKTNTEVKIQAKIHIETNAEVKILAKINLKIKRLYDDPVSRSKDNVRS